MLAPANAGFLCHKAGELGVAMKESASTIYEVLAEDGILGFFVEYFP
jgi:hypothetical protein